MTEVIGGAMVLVGGGLLTTSSIVLAGAPASAVARARELLGLDRLEAPEITPELQSLLDQLP